MLTEQVDYVVGVGTHRDQHALAVVDARTGAVVAQTTTAANARGYKDAVRFADRYAPGDRLWAIEGSGHYGAGLARQLQHLGEQVHEVDRTSRGERRLHGKDDQLDAVRAARSPLAREHRTRPRAGEHQEALRLLMLARRTAVETRKVALVQLRSVIVTAPDELREELRRLPLGELLNRCSRFRRSRSRTPSELATILVLRTLAQRIKAATGEAETLEREILSHVRAVAPELLDEPGVGPIVAAQLIVTWSHRGRIDSEACFARLAGVAPLPASSGQTTRHRLSRGGDRQLNRALHTIVLHRRQHDPATRDYIARRLAEGKTARDATLTEALPRPTPLPRHAERRARNNLTVIGASFVHAGPCERGWICRDALASQRLDERLRRVSDSEREQAVEALRDDLVAGRLSLDEFSERVGVAYGARVGAELSTVREGLPEPVSQTRRPRVRLSLAAFGHLVRRGRLRLPRRTLAISAFADLDLDLREAEIDARRVTVHVYTLVGNVDVYVPEGIDVAVGGVIIFGRRRDWGRDTARAAEPSLRVRAHGLFGTVDVWRVPTTVRGTYGEVIAQVKEQQRQLPT